MTPAPDPEPEPIFQPLKPARTKAPLYRTTDLVNKTDSNATVDVESRVEEGFLGSGPFSSGTFGSKSACGMVIDDLASSTGGTLSPVFKQIRGPEDIKRSSFCMVDNKRYSKSSDACSIQSNDSFGNPFTAPIAREVRRALGRPGTLGGSDISGYTESRLDASDPDSDVPDELKFILAARSETGSIVENLSPDTPTPAFVPKLSALADTTPQTNEPPIFRITLTDEDDQNGFGIDGESAHSSEEDTKKSFDFTGEIMKLNESGASDRASFVEQLEMAFKTPAKVDLHYDFSTHLCVEAPPLPPLPGTITNTTANLSSPGLEYPSRSQLLDVDEPSDIQSPKPVSTSDDSSSFDISVSRLVDVREPTLLHTAIPDESKEQLSQSNELTHSTRSTQSGQSEGELNRSFKFGGRPDHPPHDHELTLSDIIPPPEFARAISEVSLLDGIEDDSVLKSIYAKLMGKECLDDFYSQSNSVSCELDGIRKASRPASGISFSGFETFDEVRRGFEFSGDRSFYPPPAHANRRGKHRREESVFSIASVSTYGRVLNNGVNDPFDYGLPSLRERPSSEDISSISMSMTVDDTFAFIHNQPRRRVDSDASSFYFRPVALATRGHGRRESSISVTSQAPPISKYNRSFGYHRRNDSSASSSSIAISYAKHGANSGISAWARHQRDASVDSVMSDFSAMYLGRPGIGDKMFDHAVDLGPLTSISASPPNASYDSIMDNGQRSSMEDSLFEDTGQRCSMSSDSVFGDDASHPYSLGLLPPNQFRPLSALSFNSNHGPIHEDDTMISVSVDCYCPECADNVADAGWGARPAPVSCFFDGSIPMCSHREAQTLYDPRREGLQECRTPRITQQSSYR